MLYDIPSTLLALVLLAAMLACIALGHRIGRARATVTTPASREHVNALQSAILGLLALLLAFTFSLALQRFDGRAEAVVDEANAIGTAYLRADLLAPPLRDEVRRALAGYVDLRVQESTTPLHLRDARGAIDDRAVKAQDAIWRLAMQAAQAPGATVATNLFVQAVNEMIDSFGRRSASVERHVPELVIEVLFATFLLAGGVLGFAAGVAGHRPSFVAYAAVLLMVVMVFIVLDLDRPRRGIIQVDYRPLLALQASMHGLATP